VVLLILSNTLQNAIIGNDNSITGGLIGAVTILALNYAVARLTAASRIGDSSVKTPALPREP
jgi:uncharacterized membrane protein YcaP (DUF421 family)